MAKARSKHAIAFLWLPAARNANPKTFQNFGELGCCCAARCSRESASPGWPRLHLCKRGQPGEALSLLQRAAQQQPSSPKFWNVFGFALRAAGNHKKAIACFERALAIAPEFNEVY